MHESDVDMSVNTQTGACLSSCLYGLCAMACMMEHVLIGLSERGGSKWRSPSMRERQREAFPVFIVEDDMLERAMWWMRCRICMFLKKKEDVCSSDGCSLCSYSYAVVCFYTFKNPCCFACLWPRRQNTKGKKTSWTKVPPLQFLHTSFFFSFVAIRGLVHFCGCTAIGGTAVLSNG